MTKAQFRKRWDSNEDGEGITFDDIAQCAVDWDWCRTQEYAGLM